MARGFSVSGDHAGQARTGHRWPFGPVALITPFNFPLEIPALQLMGALFMGNKPLVHVDHRVGGWGGAGGWGGKGWGGGLGEGGCWRRALPRAVVRLAGLMATNG